MVLSTLNIGEPLEAHRLSEDLDSTCSTPYVSAPSTPSHGPSGYFFSAPASPMHLTLSKAKKSSSDLEVKSTESLASAGSFEFEFSSRFSPSSSPINGCMSSAEELFLNGQIRPMKLSSHLQTPQFLAPLLDLEIEEEEEEEEDERFDRREVTVTRGRDLRFRNRSLHRKTKSLSPLRNGESGYPREPRQFLDSEDSQRNEKNDGTCGDTDTTNTPSMETTPSDSASSSRSSSSGRNSKKWIFLKDLLYRSKSEGRGNGREKFWFSASSKEKKVYSPSASRDEKEKSQNQSRKLSSAKKSGGGGKPANGVSKRRVPLSAHELHYTTNRAQAEEMKKKTFLPYRQGLLGCLAFSSKSYGAFSGFTRTLNRVSSR